MVGDPMGKTILRDSEEDNTSKAEQVGIGLARKMLESGASEIIAGVEAQ